MTIVIVCYHSVAICKYTHMKLSGILRTSYMHYRNKVWDILILLKWICYNYEHHMPNYMEITPKTTWLRSNIQCLLQLDVFFWILFHFVDSFITYGSKLIFSKLLIILVFGWFLFSFLMSYLSSESRDTWLAPLLNCWTARLMVRNSRIFH